MASIEDKIQNAKLRAGNSQAVELPEDITEQEFIDLVNYSPASQMFALIERSKTHVNLFGLDVGRGLLDTRTRAITKTVDKMFDDIEGNHALA